MSGPDQNKLCNESEAVWKRSQVKYNALVEIAEAKMNFKEALTLFYDVIVFMITSVIYTLEAIVMYFVPQRFREKSLEGEVALVTGGAGGIGQLVSAKLAKLGCHVVIWDVNKTGVERTVEKIRDSGGKCTGYHCDIANRDEVYKSAKAVKVDVGNVTILVNNAGYVYGNTLMNIPDHAIEHTFNVNILSQYWTTKAFLGDMMKDNHGHVVTVASVAGLLGTYNCTDYSATKFAAVGFHESLYTELKSNGYDGIKTTLVCPYLINTGMFEGVSSRLLPILEPEYVAEKIVSAILTNAVDVILPPSIRYIIPLKSLLPEKVCWSILSQIVQSPQCMMTLKVKHADKIDCNEQVKKIK